VQALGVPEGRLEIIIGQLVSVRSGDAAGRLSKRAGNVINLRDVVDEVGKDACRFFFLSRSADSQMEFDLDLAKKQSNENPVYYVQYAHARIAGILNQAAERGLGPEGGDVSLLNDPAELALIRKMLLLPELIESIAESHEPHHLPHYAMELATTFHDFYERCRVMPRHLDEEGNERTPADDEVALARARLRLVAAAKVALSRTLGLMGMEAPERM
jgi:arginyl-tRNA synthetase